MLAEDFSLKYSCVNLYKRFLDLYIGLETGLSKHLDNWLSSQWLCRDGSLSVGEAAA